MQSCADAEVSEALWTCQYPVQVKGAVSLGGDLMDTLIMSERPSWTGSLKEVACRAWGALLEISGEQSWRRPAMRACHFDFIQTHTCGE